MKIITAQNELYGKSPWFHLVLITLTYALVNLSGPWSCWAVAYTVPRCI